MSSALQIKRTSLALTDNKIKNIVLAKGEPFVYNGTDRKLFIGDGASTIAELVSANKYIEISSKILAEQIVSVNMNSISGLEEDLDNIHGVLDGLDSDIDGVNSRLDSLDDQIDLSKLYYAICSTPSNTPEKQININIPIEKINDNIDLSKYDGLTLVVKFVHNNTSENPSLVVNSSQSTPNTIIVSSSNGKMYIGETPVGGPFNWKDNDTLIFVFSYSTTLNNELNCRMNMAGTSANRILASWCDQNNVTLINGGMIATGSITADKIQAGSITADQIAVGSLPASVLSQQFSTALNNLNFIEQQAASSRQVICTCESPSEAIIKDVYLNDDDALSIGIINEMPIYGTSLVIKFTNRNTSTNGTSLRLILNGFYFPQETSLVPPIGYYDSDNLFRGLDVNSELNWDDGDTRVLIFDGAHWIIQPPSGYIRRAAEWCLANNQTFIQGGSIIAGRISCAQLDAGTIDTSKISLSYYSYDAEDHLINYGGFDHYDGSTTNETTKGVIMYGSDKDNYNFLVTNKGLGINIKSGSIFGWYSEHIDPQDDYSFWQILSNKIEIGTGYNVDETINEMHTKDLSNLSIGHVTYTYKYKPDDETQETTISVPASNTYMYGNLDLSNIILLNLPTTVPQTAGKLYIDNHILKVS